VTFFLNLPTCIEDGSVPTLLQIIKKPALNPYLSRIGFYLFIVIIV
jgi:hypothetical protein